MYEWKCGNPRGGLCRLRQPHESDCTFVVPVLLTFGSCGFQRALELDPLGHTVARAVHAPGLGKTENTLDVLMFFGCVP